ncbi:hypothetical protein DNTS_033305 [Danionella cerebrum]|uniref:BTB domain-containing protein n=1 Tax=Danionella cerebrum TaxID=2873325 RepID=A0A553PN10_9TELE|nr:hypothetical protein DNTS_033305 [Danionella translucida]
MAVSQQFLVSDWSSSWRSGREEEKKWVDFSKGEEDYTPESLEEDAERMEEAELQVDALERENTERLENVACVSNDGDGGESVKVHENNQNEVSKDLFVLGQCLQADDNESQGQEEHTDPDGKELEATAKKMYFDLGFPTMVFQILENMRLNSVLTDLTLYTDDGHQFHVHSMVLSAVSNYIQTKLRLKSRTKRVFSLNLAPEVHGWGLAAVIEFAYTGTIRNLNQNNLGMVWSAAVSLDAFEILERFKGVEKGGDEEYMKVGLQEIRKLWTQRVGCDVKIETEGEVFHAHRVILAASSDYFRGMFTSGMRETKQEMVSLYSVDSSRFKSLLHYCYCGSIALGWGNVFDLACTTLQFQFQTAFSHCMSFLHEEISAHSCLDVASFAEAYEIKDLFTFANDFVLRHFQDVSVTPQFQDLPIEKLKKFLHSDSLCVSSELTVFKAVMAWIEAFPEQRVKLARDLMGSVQFHLMTYEEFTEVKSITTLSRRGAKKLYKSLLKEFCASSSQIRSNFRAYIPKNSIALVGGEIFTENLDKRVPCLEMWFSNSLQNHVGLVKKVEWRMLGMLPEKPRFSHGVVVIMGKLYIAGGRHYYGKDDTMRSTYRYDPVVNSWQKLADMNENRGSFVLMVLNGQMYAIGGERDSQSNLESVEVYCHDKNSWSFVHPLDHSLCGHAATVWNGAIFISGGLDSQYHCQSSMILYHPDHGSTYRAEMRRERALHCMEALGERFYVAGGVSSDAEGHLEDQLFCEVYDPVANEWSAIASVSVPHVGAASAVLEGKVYVIGGYCYKDYSDTRSVHRYNTATEQWENMGPTPGPNVFLAACVLPVPDHLRQ